MAFSDSSYDNLGFDQDKINGSTLSTGRDDRLNTYLPSPISRAIHHVHVIGRHLGKEKLRHFYFKTDVLTIGELVISFILYMPIRGGYGYCVCVCAYGHVFVGEVICAFMCL